MAGALDDDARRAIDEGRETAGAMLRSAQRDLQKVFVVFVVGFLGTFYLLRLYVWDFLRGVTEARMDAATRQGYDIIAQTPFDVLLLQAKIGMVAGVLIAIPALLYVSRDALRERGLWPSSPVAPWKLAVLLGASACLFAFGLAYGFYVFFPVMFSFLAGNALSVGFKPTYSIVLWAEFIFLLTLSFGLAAQLPLVVTGLSYSGVVEYETFRDKWRYAVVGMVAAGAMFTPPDPFTQIMWATPMIALYGVSLYLAKVVVTAKRGRERVSVRGVARRNWNTTAGSAVLGFVAVYAFYARGGVAVANDLLARIGSSRRLLAAGTTLPVEPAVAAAVWGVGGAAVGVVVALAYHVYAELEAAVDPLDVGDPSAIDLDDLDAAGVRAAPPEAFADLTEDEAAAVAGRAMDAGDAEKARAVLDRYDAVTDAAGDGDDPAEGTGPSVGADVEDRTRRAVGVLADDLSDEDAEAVGGYVDDLRAVVDALTSRSFRILAVFAVVLSVTFGWLYTGGIGAVFRDFLARLPAEVTPETFNVVALHPMEALIFQVKFSVIVAVAAVLPMVAYYAWPALREREVVDRRAETILGWTAALVAGLVGGFAVGYLYVAPTVVSYLVADAVAADMVIRYRITNFFWLIFFTTAGIGLLADVPILMVLLNTAGVSYRTMRERWREVVVGVLLVAALFTPADVFTMLLVTIPLMVAYAVGLGVLFVLTLGGRRDLDGTGRTSPG